MLKNIRFFKAQDELLFLFRNKDLYQTYRLYDKVNSYLTFFNRVIAT